MNKGEFKIWKTVKPLKQIKQIKQIQPLFKNATLEKNTDYTVEFAFGYNVNEMSVWKSENELEKTFFNTDSLLYFYVKITFLIDTDIQLKTVNLYSEQWNTLIKHETSCQNCNEQSTLHGPSFLVTGAPGYSPYSSSYMTKIFDIRDDMLFNMNSQFGWDIMYAKTIPISESAEVVFHEWTLFNVTEPKCMKCIVPDNTFPSFKLNMNSAQMYFDDFEIYFSKRYFESIFGNGSRPQERDIIFVNFTNRLYEIQASFLENQYYWQVTLKKYEQSSNRKETSEFKNKIDAITFSRDKNFMEDMNIVTDKVVKTQHLHPTIGSEGRDIVRKHVNDCLKINNTDLLNYWTVLSKSHYDLSSLIDCASCNQYDKAVIYHIHPEIKDELLFTCWFNPVEHQSKNISIKTDIKIIPLSNSEFTFIQFPTIEYKLFKNNDTIILKNLCGLSVLGTIFGNPSNNIITLQINSQDWNAEFTEFQSNIVNNWSIEFCKYSNLLSCYENNLGWEIGIINTDILYFKNGMNQSYLKLNQSIKYNEWYGFNCTFNKNISNEIEFNIWQKSWNQHSETSPQTTKLNKIFTGSIICPDGISVQTTVPYYLNSAYCLLTNLRVYYKSEYDDAVINEMLNERYVTNSHLSVLIDNALDTTRFVYIGNAK